MLEGGDDVRFLTRRLVILASEDIGNADPHALPLAVATMQACEFVGLLRRRQARSARLGLACDLPSIDAKREITGVNRRCVKGFDDRVRVRTHRFLRAAGCCPTPQRSLASLGRFDPDPESTRFLGRMFAD